MVSSVSINTMATPPLPYKRKRDPVTNTTRLPPSKVQVQVCMPANIRKQSAAERRTVAVGGGNIDSTIRTGSVSPVAQPTRYLPTYWPKNYSIQKNHGYGLQISHHHPVLSHDNVGHGSTHSGTVVHRQLGAESWIDSTPMQGRPQLQSTQMYRFGSMNPISYSTTFSQNSSILVRGSSDITGNLNGTDMTWNIPGRIPKDFRSCVDGEFTY